MRGEEGEERVAKEIDKNIFIGRRIYRITNAAFLTSHDPVLHLNTKPMLGEGVIKESFTVKVTEFLILSIPLNPGSNVEMGESWIQLEGSAGVSQCGVGTMIVKKIDLPIYILYMFSHLSYVLMF